MERGSIKINYEEGKTPSVEIQPAADNTVWLTKYEMARLLNCFPQSIEANLCSIFKNRLLWEDDCTHNRRYTDKGIEKQCLYYNLEVLIFISYRVNTLEAKIFREFINTALQEHLQREKTPKNSTKLVWLFQPPMNYSWN